MRISDWSSDVCSSDLIVLYSTPGLNVIARKLSALRPDLEQRLFHYQVGSFIRDGDARAELVPRLFEQFHASRPAFWRHTSGMLGRSAERRVGKECVRTCSTRWSADH